MHRLIKIIGPLLVLMTLVARPATAGSILVRSGTTLSAEGGYGDAGWETLTSLVNTASGNQVTVAADYLNNAQVQLFDALWVNTGSRFGTTTLSAAELANLAQFITSGKRVVLFGENVLWATWNNNILSVVGGTQAGGVSGLVSTVFAHALTAGVTQLNIGLGAAAGPGGTSLFSQNVATLWGTGNVLTFLDSTTLQNAGLGTVDNAQFAQNLATWISASPTQATVPEPATWLLVGVGLTAAAVRRRSVSRS